MNRFVSEFFVKCKWSKIVVTEDLGLRGTKIELILNEYLLLLITFPYLKEILYMI